MSAARAHADHYIPVSNPRGGSEESRPRSRPLTIPRSRIVAQLRSEKRTSLPLTAPLRPSHLPRAIAYHFFPEETSGGDGKKRRNRCCHCRHRRPCRCPRACISERVSLSPLLANAGPVSLDECGSSHAINVKRGLNSNPSRAAGRAIGNYPFHLRGEPRSL